MKNLWKKRISEHRKDERGTTIIETVIAIVLFVAIGGSFLYASITIEDARKTSMVTTKSALNKIHLSTSFRGDVANARGLIVNTPRTSVAMAKTDGSCVRWTIETNPSTNQIRLLRAVATGATPSGGGAEVVGDLSGGSIALFGNELVLNITPKTEMAIKETVKLSLAGSNGGGCW